MTDGGQRYRDAAHAMLTGTGYELASSPQHPDTDVNHKHMQHGINSAHVSIGALATLLIEKGVFTLEEYTAASADAMEAEVARMEAELTSRYGTKVTLR